ncbi:VanZ family protein [Streptomyces sp. NPDC059568]|uniref:VanZ family protein n=1 Tax=Streptomyces sp. NPDC059568 TaxID=3346868 RepID=UPI0036935D46
MIKASIAAVPGLFFSFLIVAILFAVPVALIARARKKPVVVRVLLAMSVAGVVSVTLLPGHAGTGGGAQCDSGWPTHLLTSPSALLNVALFLPGAALGILVFRRPVTVAAVWLLFSTTVEFIQAMVPMGRSCSVTDIAANAMGTMLGVGAGAAWLRLRDQRFSGFGRDAAWGAGLAVAGAAAMVALFQSQVSGTDLVAADDRREAFAQRLEGSDQWMESTAVGVFGTGTKVNGTRAETIDTRTKITASTDRGDISGWWPDRTLEQAWTSNTRGDEGSLSQAQVTDVARKFAQKWLPQNVEGSTEKTRPMGEGPTKVYLISYRRYVYGVMAPMRLDITVTTAGRVMGFTAETVPDPDLPKPVLTEEDAKRLVHEKTDARIGNTILLAQRVGGQWRPVWLVGAGDKDVFLDAVNGQQITPDQ